MIWTGKPNIHRLFRGAGGQWPGLWPTLQTAIIGLRARLSKTPDASFNAPAVSFTYTANGLRHTMSDVSGATTYGYDTRNRLISKQTPFGTLSYTYDNAGDVLTLASSNTNGVSLTYTYDPLNRLATVTDNRLLAQGATSGLTTYNYDAVGNLQNFVYPNGVTSAYSYDTLNRLTQIGSSKNAAALSNYVYTLGLAGNRTSVAELTGRTVAYGYDSLYRLTSETVTADPHNNNGVGTYTYDNVGNRKTLTSTLAPQGGMTYNYDADDRLGSDQYDSAGNTINSVGIANTYDFENHLISHGGVTIAYDGDGNRVKETVAGVTTNYLVDTQNPTGYAQVVDEIVAGTVTRMYAYGLERISENQIISSTWTPSFYGYDGHGSVRQLTNSTGAVTDSYDYDAFGNLINSTGSTPNNYLFAGEQYDPALGLYYNRARYLNTTAGRFWSTDTFEGNGLSPLSIHKYLYASDDPVDAVDPGGHEDLGSISAAEGISEEIDATASEEDFAAKKVLSLKVVDIYSCSRLQAYIIPIHCWVYANEPGNEGVRYDISAGLDRGPGLILGSVSGTLQVRPTTLAAVQQDANLSFNKQASLSQLGFLRWQAVILAEFEFLSFTEQVVTYSTNYSFNTLSNDAVNCVTFTGAAIAAAKQIEATDQ